MLEVEADFKSRASQGPEKMKIGELAKQAGVNASAIRYYERCRLLPAAPRVGGQRRYSAEALDRVLLIRLAGDMDFTLAEIRLFLSGFRDSAPVSERWRKLTKGKIAELESRLDRMQRLLRLLHRLGRCRCVQLHECVRALAVSPRVAALGREQKRIPSRRRGGNLDG
jgi:MerR family transcriptional regulator, redox-sensitive transcriptional activator SoxR